jgi:geranylgeranyl reductase family protein
MYDVIVIGAGPAGASAARTAAQHGLKTLLLEKERVPRSKLCGGGVTPKVLTRLDFKLPKELIECEAGATRIHVGESVHHFETDQTLVYMTSRAKFDAFLTEKAVEAGSEFRDRSPVHDLEVTSSHAEVKTSGESFQSKILIGADGMGGPTARLGGFYHSWKPDQVAYAIESEVYVGEKAVQEFTGASSYFDLYFGVSRAGYGWIFPKGDHLTVGVGCRLSRLRDGIELFNGFIKRVHELERFEIPKPQAHLIPLGGAAKVPSVRDRMLLAGDCAGFAEPMLGEGIYFSMWGGQIAAQVAVEACRQERFDSSLLAAYGQRCRKAFGVDFKVAYRVARMSYLEQYDMDRVARFFFDERHFQECMVGLMDGTIRYRDARVKLAWPYLKYRLARIGLPFYS